MPMIGRLIGGLHGLFKKRQAEQELDEELRAYLEAAVDQKMAAGMSRDAARRAARVEMGGLEATKDRVRDAGWESLVESLWQDLRYAIRLLRKSPVFSTVAVLTLALGIGANTAIFGVVNSLLLRTLPVAEPQRLVTVSSNQVAAEGGIAAPWTYPIWREIQQRGTLFDGALASAAAPFNLAQGGEMERVDGLFVSGDYFATLGVPALLGRTLTADDDARGGGADSRAAVISYRFWQRHFGGAANAIGAPLVVERVPVTVIGVTPPAFFGTEVGQTFDVALPFAAEPEIRGDESRLEEHRAYWLTVMLRLKPRQSLGEAIAALRGVQPQIREAAMPPDAPISSRQRFFTDPLTLVPAAAGTSRLRQQYQHPLLVVLVVVGLVLIIACANIANLLLARANARRHELSVRLALGAPRWRLARQLMIESLVLATIGSAVGLLFAAWGGRALVSQLSLSGSPVFLDLSIDWRLIAFTTAAAIATTMLFGTGPAFRATRAAPIDALRVGRSAGSRRGTVSSGMVVAQVALSMVLVVAAGLFVRTFERLASVPLGFDSDRVLVVNVNVTRAAGDPAKRGALYQRLVEAAAAVPGVEKAAASMYTPLGGRSWTFPADVPGSPTVSDRDRSVRGHLITPGWLATYGTSLRTGRDVERFDAGDTPLVALVNEAFVRKFLAGHNALGRTFSEPSPGGGEATVRTIVGVVGDAVYRSLREDPPPTVYVPLAQGDGRGGEIRVSVRSSGAPPIALVRSLAAALTAVDRNTEFRFRPLEDEVSASLVQERLLARLSAFFGGLALLLAGLGLYGVTAYAVTRRQTEMGIRMALGATRVEVIRLVLGRSLALTAAGIVLGLTAAATVTRYLESLLFGLTPLDPTTFIAVSVLFAAVAAIAAYVPARRAAGVDPNVALRCE